MTRGVLVLAPVGSGKTYWLRKINNTKWLDGDTLLKKENIKNFHYYWYSDNKIRERNEINNIFEKYMSDGYNILYSGNPEYMKYDILIIPDKFVRKERLDNRKAYIPRKNLFDLENDYYEKHSKICKYIFRCNIDDYLLCVAEYISKH